MKQSVFSVVKFGLPLFQLQNFFSGFSASIPVICVFAIFATTFPVGAAGSKDGEKAAYLMKTYTYKRVGNLNINADVYLPSGGTGQPAIMYIHGGALINGSRTNSYITRKFSRYLDAGYVVVSIDYRLAPETKLPGIIEDVEDAYAWMLREGPKLFNIDPDRIAVMGGSAGGYLTLTAGFRLKPRPRALVSFYGYGDVTGDWYAKPDPYYLKHPPVEKDEAFQAVSGEPISNTDHLTEEQKKGRGRFYLYCRQNGLWPDYVGGRDPVEDAEWFAAYEARHNVTANYPPTVLLHGGMDTDVPFEQSRLMAAELQRHGVDYKLISQPNWRHGFDALDDPEIQQYIVETSPERKNDLPKPNDPAVRQAHADILAFLKKYLKK